MTIDTGGPLLLAGAGKMGGAMLAGWLKNGLSPRDVVILDPCPSPASLALIEQRNIKTIAAPAALPVPAVIVLAIKPQMMPDALPAIAALGDENTLFISIAAGLSLAALAKLIGGGRSILRAMPNTPAAIGCGMTVVCANAAVTKPQREMARALLEATGEMAWLEDEAQMDAVTALSGSGPAYVFWMAECMAKAGEQLGLEPALAAQLASATVSGSGALIKAGPDTPAQLRINVTSPGGTTAAALDVLMGDNGLSELMAQAMSAAAERSRKLSG